MPGTSVCHLFLKDEARTVCREALTAAINGFNARELANLCLQSKGFDVNDAALRKGIQATLTGILIAASLRKVDPDLKPSTFRSHMKRLADAGVIRQEGVRGSYVLIKRDDAPKEPSEGEYHPKPYRVRPLV